MEFAKNVGENDRKIRVIAGVIIVLWGMFAANWLGAIGLVLILTGVYRTCPAYTVLQMDTLEKK
jgi:hypothetical protein